MNNKLKHSHSLHKRDEVTVSTLPVAGWSVCFAVPCLHVISVFSHANAPVLFDPSYQVALGTVTNIEEAVKWLSYTYLYVRMRANPLVYGINHKAYQVHISPFLIFIWVYLSDPLFLFIKWQLLEMFLSALLFFVPLHFDNNILTSTKTLLVP